jgi:hypothetical protein
MTMWMIDEDLVDGEALVGIVMTMPKVGMPMLVEVSQGRLCRTSIVQSVSSTAEGVLVRTLSGSYLLGARGMLYRVRVSFDTDDRAADAADEPAPAPRPRPARRHRALVVGGLASLGFVAVTVVAAAGGAPRSHADDDARPVATLPDPEGKR